MGMSMAARVCLVAAEFVGPFPNGGVGTAYDWEAQVVGAAGCDVTVRCTGATVTDTPACWSRHLARTAPSVYMAKWARQHWQIEGATVAPHCFDPAAARPSERVERRGPFRHLVFFGRLETRKRLHLLCGALAGGQSRARGRGGRIGEVPASSLPEALGSFAVADQQGSTANIGAVRLPAHLPDEFRGIEQAIVARLRNAHADAAA